MKHLVFWTKHFRKIFLNEKIIIKNTYEIGAILEANKRAAASSVDGRFGREMLHHVAEIPNVFITKFQREHGVDVFSQDPEQKKKLRKLLEHPDYRFLKTTVKKLWRPRGVK